MRLNLHNIKSISADHRDFSGMRKFNSLTIETTDDEGRNFIVELFADGHDDNLRKMLIEALIEADTRAI